MDPIDREPGPHGQDVRGGRTAHGGGADRRVSATSAASAHGSVDPKDGAGSAVPGAGAAPGSGKAPRAAVGSAFLPVVRARGTVDIPGAARTPERTAHRSRPPRDPFAADLGTPHPARRPVRLVAGDLLLTVNPVDGSEIETCPPTELPGPPARHAPEERREARRAATAPVPSGVAVARPPLLERDEERERLVRLIARGGSARVSGPAGSGRTALLDAVAEECADLAPDGVVRLTGYRKTATDLLHDLFAAVFDGTGYRPDREALLDHVRGIGAVVVVDDLAFGGSPLDELLDATPECAFLLAAAPDTPAPSADAPVDEVVLNGLSRAASTELLERAAGRDLTESETNWAGDLWFESEGLPLRFVQAGALLRQRDARLPDADPEGAEESADAGDERRPPLPSLAEGAAPAALLAAGLSEAARSTLRFAVVLDGEVPHQAHLPALVGDTHADAALAELVAVALVTPVGARHRLAAGVRTQLLAAGYPDRDAADPDAAPGAPALVAARHYAWWTGHPSVAPRRVAAEADAVLAALAALAPGGAFGGDDKETIPLDPADEGDGPSVRVGLARAAAPVLAAGGDWSAWEAVLRLGVEAARHTGEVADEAYFHHELGVLALCGAQYGRARAELEASVAMRGAVADRRGAVAGRRALALLTDRSGELPPVPLAVAPPPVPPIAVTRAVPLVPAAAGTPGGPVGRPVRLRPVGGMSARVRRVRRTVLHGTRRNLAATGAGALLAAVLGTVVTLGMISGEGTPPAERVGPGPTVSRGAEDRSATGDPNDTSSTDRPDDTQKVAEVEERTGSPTRPTAVGTPSPTATRAPGVPTVPQPGTSAPTGPAEPTGSTGPQPTDSPSEPEPTDSAPPSESPDPEPSTSQPPPTTPTGGPSSPPEPSTEPTEPVNPSPPASQDRPVVPPEDTPSTPAAGG
ncbi:ATP-binding protein [Streptomyces sp. NPDC002490]|uniref:ATP-binding protein n=1 Tax=Streptomyces sp. NPDC002490 TaxID=3154416 RepID=UPI00333320D0